MVRGKISPPKRFTYKCMDVGTCIRVLACCRCTKRASSVTLLEPL